MSSPLKFIDYHILRIDYRRNDTDDDKPIEGLIPDPELEIGVNPDNKNEFYIKLNSKILSREKNSEVNCPIKLEFEAIGFFEIEGEIDEEERDFHFGISAPSMLYGVIRTWVSQITAHSGFHSIMLPSVQFADLGKNDEDKLDNDK
ncbi:MAG: protein-export chaperone SecB [Balneolaceae bacterium]|nr:protein-export chaperone SecB [Balneolaceae bacterium]